ncbi:MAG: helix-hairpin-helix domain-containing protein [Rikenellaceae bacterium]
MGAKLTKSDLLGYLLLVAVISLLALPKYCGREQSGEAAAPKVVDSISLAPFDPNTIKLKPLLAMGFSKQQAISLIRYREAGKIFRIKEEVLGCYGMSDTLYFAIEPYIVIGEEYRYKPKEIEGEHYSQQTFKAKEQRPHLAVQPFLIDSVSAQYMVAIGAMSHSQAEVFIRWRDRGGMKDREGFKECYMVSDSLYMALLPYVIFPTKERAEPELIDLNAADTAMLISVRGIGEKSARAIIDYREKLGGYASLEQLAELKVITESNYEQIIQQIFADSCDISKIDINFAHPKVLIDHPYIDDRALRRLLKIRELKGGWRNIEQMIEDNIFTKEEAARLRPYISFREE